jgi:rare lipoprotein A
MAGLVFLNLCVLPSLAMAAKSTASTAELRQQAAVVSKKIDTMEKKLATTFKRYTTSAKELASTRKLIRKNEKRIKTLSKSIDINHEKLNSRADYLYRTKGVGFLEILFSSETINEFTDNVFMLGFLAENDAQVIDALEQEEVERTSARVDLDKMLAKQTKVTAALQEDVSEAQKELDNEQAYSDSLDDAVSAALNRERAAANAKAEAQKKKSNPKDPSQSGVKYTPTGVTFSGLATWYGVGQGTASGERFNPNAMTCAHKTLPFGTLIRVTYKGKKVVVRVNDRGPYGKGRVIDLTVRAAEKIGLKRAGVGKVTCEIVTKD